MAEPVANSPRAARRGEAKIARQAAEAAVAAAGLILFALAVHAPLPWTLLSGAGLVVAAVVIGRSLAGAPSARALLGLVRLSPRVLALVAAGLVVGGGLAATYRVYMGMALLPLGGLEAFVLVACLIGAAEEVVYRGYVQGSLAGLGWPAAVGLAAVAHAAYKTALFAFPAGAAEINYPFLAIWTVLGGIVFGLLRQFSGSVLAPLAAHAAFDLVVYGAIAQAPWWVWG
ncbi:MAG: CPBP family intramembrane metalloprotease [Planctomycetota bacterium]|nr:CPBP family intramembrane metalloprotease [Planctomycetota bacterium]